MNVGKGRVAGRLPCYSFEMWLWRWVIGTKVVGDKVSLQAHNGSSRSAAQNHPKLDDEENRVPNRCSFTPVPQFAAGVTYAYQPRGVPSRVKPADGKQPVIRGVTRS
jgi:hypothetical protein